MSVQVDLVRDSTAPSQARTLIRDCFAEDLGVEELDKAELLASELVTNAVLHGEGEITLRAALDEDRLLVEVIDEGSGFERCLRKREFGQVGGWGLKLVERESSRWGINEGTTHVWFELERPGPRLGTDDKPAMPDD